MIKFLLGAFFSASSLPIVLKVLTGLGFGIATYAAIKTAFDAVISASQASYNSMPVMLLQIAGLGGIGQAFGIIAGAMAFRISLIAVRKFQLLPK